MLMKILTFEIGWFDRVDNSSGAICSTLASDANVVRITVFRFVNILGRGAKKHSNIVFLQVRSLVGDRMALVIETVSVVLISSTLGLVIAWHLALVIIAVQPLVIIGIYTRRVLLKNMSKKLILY
jgi:ATP-binding cassette, subfamily B (MDR/TAP), member 1